MSYREKFNLVSSIFIIFLVGISLVLIYKCENFSSKLNNAIHYEYISQVRFGKTVTKKLRYPPNSLLTPANDHSKAPHIYINFYSTWGELDAPYRRGFATPGVLPAEMLSKQLVVGLEGRDAKHENIAFIATHAVLRERIFGLIISGATPFNDGSVGLDDESLIGKTVGLMKNFKNLTFLHLQGMWIDGREFFELANLVKIRDIRIISPYGGNFVVPWRAGSTRWRGGSISYREFCEREKKKYISPFSILKIFPRLNKLTIDGMDISTEDISEVCKCVSLTTLYISNSRSRAELPVWYVNSKSLENFKALTQLEYLGLGDYNLVGDGDLSFLNELKSLRRLRISGNRFTGTGFQSVGSHPTLSLIEISSRSNLSASGIDSLRRIPNLECLILRRVGISDQCFAEISKIDSLKRLSIWRCREVSAHGLAKLSEMKNLETLAIIDLENLNSFELEQTLPIFSLKELYIFKSMLSTESMLTTFRFPLIVDSANLKSIYIHRIAISNTMAEELASLTQLSRLWIADNCTISDEAFDLLRDQLPLCEVLRANPPKNDLTQLWHYAFGD